jgi:hypothetical protein
MNVCRPPRNKTAVALYACLRAYLATHVQKEFDYFCLGIAESMLALTYQ